MNLICKICDNKNVNFWFEKNSFNLYKCRNCGFIFVAEYKNFSEIYSKDYFNGAKNGFGYVDYDKDKSAMSGAFGAYLDKIEKIIPEKGKLLDIGAATGYFLEMAGQRGWEATGVEISEYASEKARVKGLNIINGVLEDADLSNETFDVITFFDLIEHVPDPKTQLLTAYKFLKKYGLIVVNTPDSNSFYAKIMGKYWHAIAPPEHLAIFNQPNFSLLLKKCGFEPIQFCKINKKFTLQYAFKILANWSGLSLAKKVAELLKNNILGSLSFPIYLRDNFFVIARKL